MAGSKNESGESVPGSGANARNAADDIRQAFSALPFEEKFSTLIRIELDMLGDVVDSVVSAASNAVDELARSCARSEPSASATAGAGGSTTTS
ncbi:MAG: hypothetical protein AABO57_01930 [Acidobacteriota bacterium]